MNLSEKYYEYVPLKTREAIKLCAKVATEFEVNLYLVGGIVRDLLLDRPFNDIDITVEGNAVKFLEYMSIKYEKKIKILSVHHEFKTVKAAFKLREGEVEVDFASTREEYYKSPAALPSLKQAGVPLENDLSRRDFTVNALAMSLNEDSFGEVVDVLGGLDDLERSIIRIIHPKSFVDDPTRIIRGLKYRTKLGFKLDDLTEYLQEEVLENGEFDGLCSERVKSEIRQTLNYNSEFAFNKLISEKIYRLLSPKISLRRHSTGKLINEIVNSFIEDINPDYVWIIYLCSLFSELDKADYFEVVEKLKLTSKEKKIFTDFYSLKIDSEFFNKVDENLDKFSVYEKLYPYTVEAIVAYLCVNKIPEIYSLFFLFIKELRFVSISITGDDLISLGIQKGPVFKDILKKVLKEKINNNISAKQEKQLLEKLFDELN